MKINHEEYWGDAMTRNCVWLIQIKETSCNKHHWRTVRVCLTREDAEEYTKQEYPDLVRGKELMLYGIMCVGLMAELLGRHVEEFKNKVECITKVKK